METTNIFDFARRDGMTDALTDLLRAGSRRPLRPNLKAIWRNLPACAQR